jgi:DDE superfamily endonuclease
VCSMARSTALASSPVEQALAPTLRPGDVVVMDNLPAHKVAGGREAIAATGARLLYLPPYSPDLNPIEQAFAKLKALLRTHRMCPLPRTRRVCSVPIGKRCSCRFHERCSGAQSWVPSCSRVTGPAGRRKDAARRLAPVACGAPGAAPADRSWGMAGRDGGTVLVGRTARPQRGACRLGPQNHTPGSGAQGGRICSK